MFSLLIWFKHKLVDVVKRKLFSLLNYLIIS